MNLTGLPKTVKKSKKRIGRGYGSGRGGHASTRGTKGQKARGKIGLFFQGTKFKKSLLKRLPLMRGKGKFKTHQRSPLVVNLKYLNLFEKNQEVNLVSLKEKGILPKDLVEGTRVKILGEGEIRVPLIVSLSVSKGAQEKIEKAGGRVMVSEKSPPTGAKSDLAGGVRSGGKVKTEISGKTEKPKERTAPKKKTTKPATKKTEGK